MHVLLVMAIVLFAPTAADAVFINVPSMAVDVTISVVGTVPLASGAFAIDDTFVLHGTGSASQNTADHCCATILRVTIVGFDVSGGGVAASGGVEAVDSPEGAGFPHAFLQLITPLYDLEFFLPGSFGAFIDPQSKVVTFSAGSVDGALVRIGEESATLIGTAEFAGTGVPEPASAILLMLGVVGVAALSRRVTGSALYDVAEPDLRDDGNGSTRHAVRRAQDAALPCGRHELRLLRSGTDSPLERRRT